MAILTGYVSSFGAATRALWGGTAGVWVPQTTATVFEIDSSSANDAAAGTGARTVLVEGLDANLAPASEVVTMNGTTAVNTTGSYLHVSKLSVLTAGSGGVNAGNIWAEKASAAVETAWMIAGDNVSTGCILGCERGASYRLTRFAGQVSCSGGATISVAVSVYRAGSGLWNTRTIWAGVAVTQQGLDLPLDVVLGAGDYARVDVTTSAASTAAAGVLYYQAA